jgi:predicted TIM-barrel fold metal-dependent hydrolase
LQIEGFFSNILALNNPILKDFGPILQALGTNFAPTADQELTELNRLGNALWTCDNVTSFQMIETYKDVGYTNAVIELKAALRRAQLRGAFRPISGEIAQQIHALPEKRSEYKRFRRARLRAGPESITVSGGLEFIIRNFQYRYVNVHDYLFEYSTGKERKIDLLVAHLVDFDWPIANGLPTATSLEAQVQVMEQITRLTNGRVHCFAPYDPLKEVAFRLGLAPTSSLGLVQSAISHHGFIGVKMYPPMGFAPFLNYKLGSTFWNVPWLPKPLRRPDMGHLLDDALSELYAWCLANGVPIMAHTSPTNGPSSAFMGLTKAYYWKAVRDAFPGIRVDFGHFGDTDLVQDNGARARRLVDLMTPGSSSTGRNLYADSAYFSDILSDQDALASVLASLLKYNQQNGDATLTYRLMYGTDWEMIIVEGSNTDRYLDRFEAIFKRLSSDPLFSNRFFGGNAANFLGLKAGQAVRDRLNLFYAVSVKPAWMTKVDSLNLTA